LLPLEYLRVRAVFEVIRGNSEHAW
jgi:hypothetical protein